MSLTGLTTLLGWMTVINFGLLLFSGLVLLLFRHSLISIHERLTGIDAARLKPAYLYFLGTFKLLIVFFNLVPYLALKLL